MRPAIARPRSYRSSLIAEGLDCFRILFPKGMDANEYALKVTPAAKSLGLVIRKAQWLGKGEPQPIRTTMAAPTVIPAVATEAAAKEEIPAATVLPMAPTPSTGCSMGSRRHALRCQPHRCRRWRRPRPRRRCVMKKS